MFGCCCSQQYSGVAQLDTAHYGWLGFDPSRPFPYNKKTWSLSDTVYHKYTYKDTLYPVSKDGITYGEDVLETELRLYIDGTSTSREIRRTPQYNAHEADVRIRWNAQSVITTLSQEEISRQKTKDGFLYGASSEKWIEGFTLKSWMDFVYSVFTPGDNLFSTSGLNYIARYIFTKELQMVKAEDRPRFDFPFAPTGSWDLESAAAYFINDPNTYSRITIGLSVRKERFYRDGLYCVIGTANKQLGAGLRQIIGSVSCVGRLSGSPMVIDAANPSLVPIIDFGSYIRFAYWPGATVRDTFTPVINYNCCS